MVSKKSRSEIRRKKHMKLRNRFSGTAERPRLAVFRSNNHMYAQIIDDTVGNTLESKRLYLTVEDSFIRVRSKHWQTQQEKPG